MIASLLNRFAQDTTVTDPTLEQAPLEITTSPTFTSEEVEASNGVLAAIGTTGIIIYLAVVAFFLLCQAKIFQKAGEKWWAAIVPIYNIYILLKIVGRPGWWLILLLIPFINIIFALILTHDLSKSFGHGIGTTLLLLFFPIIMYPIMAFSGDYKYVGAAADPNFTPGSSPNQSSHTSSPASAPGAGAPIAAAPSAAAGTAVGVAQPTTSTPNAPGQFSVSPSPESQQAASPGTQTPPAPQVAAAPENPVQVPPVPEQASLPNDNGPVSIPINQEEQTPATPPVVPPTVNPDVQPAPSDDDNPAQPPTGTIVG